MVFVEFGNIVCKFGCIGKVIFGGEFMLLDDDDVFIYVVDMLGELCYRGENIMFGYVELVVVLFVFLFLVWLKIGDFV